MPSIIWLLLKQIHSPWWLENVLSTPFIIVVLYSVLMLALLYFISYPQCVGYFLINLLLAIILNNSGDLNNIVTIKDTATLNNSICIEPVTFFQFNIKYTEQQDQLNELITYLIAGQYHLITLQGVSQQSKLQLIQRLSPYYPYFVRGESDVQHVYSDQLIFSQYAFSDIKYYKSGDSAFFISSQWQLPFNEIKLHTLHPPSPRNEKLWQTRNKTLYQLKNALYYSPVNSYSPIKSDSPVKEHAISNAIKTKRLINSSLVIGDLNLSKHSSRIQLLIQGMNTEFVNSWPKKGYVYPLFGLAIDHFWVSKPATICARQRLNQFSWSDHYAVITHVNFNKQHSSD